MLRALYKYLPPHTLAAGHVGFIKEQHCPETDCEATLRLFEAYYGQTRALEDAKKKLLARRPAASWAKNNNYKWEGVCMAAFMPEKCICGQPTLKTSY